MNEKQLFSGHAESYTKGRPTYATELIDFLFDEVGMKANSKIADIGAGTGIFSKQLLSKGCNVFCVEPNEDMRNALGQNVQAYKNFTIIDGDAENTKLDNSSVDFITAAQAFHWFSVDKFLIESKRILKPDGISVLVWNSRKDCEFNRENHCVFKKFCPRFKGFSGGIEQIEELISKYFNGSFDYKEFDNPLFYNKQQFINRCLSASYSLMPNDTQFNDYLNDIEALFNKYAENCILNVPNKSVIYWGKVG